MTGVKAAVYVLVLVALAGTLAYALRAWNPQLSAVTVDLVQLQAPNQMVAGDDATVQAAVQFDRPGDYLVRFELCHDGCEALRWGVPVEGLLWEGELARLSPEPGRYEAVLRVRERFEGVFFRTVFEERWELVVHAP